MLKLGQCQLRQTRFISCVPIFNKKLIVIVLTKIMKVREKNLKA